MKSVQSPFSLGTHSLGFLRFQKTLLDCLERLKCTIYTSRPLSEEQTHGESPSPCCFSLRPPAVRFNAFYFGRTALYQLKVLANILGQSWPLSASH